MTLIIRRAVEGDAVAVAEVYLTSFRTALPGIRLAHTDDEVRGWIREHVVEQHEAWVAEQDGRIVGMLGLEPGWIGAFYLLPEAQGQGIGRTLLEQAKARQPGGLQLWAFQVNARARRFYARNGFVEVELTDGAGNEEREPDVRMVWRPDDAEPPLRADGDHDPP